MSSADVIPPRKHSATPASCRRPRSRRTARPFRGKQACQETIEVEVVGEAAEHRHRQVGVGVDEPRHDDRTPGVDRPAGLDRVGERADVGDNPAVDEHRRAGVDGPQASIETTVASAT